MATNSNRKASYKMKKNQAAYIICRIVADHLGIDPSMVTPDSKLEEDLAANVKEIMDIIHSIATITNVSFDEDVEELALSVTYVDDLIEKALGESFFGKSLIDDEEDDEEVEVDPDAEEERFNSFLESYNNGDYGDYEIKKLSDMFLNEAENCKDSVIASKYRLVSTVVRMQFFAKEWINYSFRNYPDDDLRQELTDYCVADALVTIQKSIEGRRKGTEDLLVRDMLSMIHDYWYDVESTSDILKKYGELELEYADADDDCIFNHDWLLQVYYAVHKRLSDIDSTRVEHEKEYAEAYKEFLQDYGEIGPRERKRLERDRVRLNITKERAQELEADALTPSLTKEEQQYLDEYREMMVDYGGELGPIEKKRLNRLRFRLGIERIRAFELELL